MSQAVHHLGLIKQELPSAVQILAVSKNHPTAAIKPLLEIGHRQFAENKVQEAADKWPALKAQYPDICLSMIGHLQTNKADQAVQIFDEIQSLDRPKLADALKKALDKAAKPAMPLWIQVNIGGEAQKSGIDPADLRDFYGYCQKLGLNIKGLMAIPPAGVDPTPYFQEMFELKQQLGLNCLSMGMSSDYLTAIKYGATHIRLGTHLFGER